MSEPSPGAIARSLIRRLPMGLLGMLAILSVVESHLFQDRETYCAPGSQELQLAWKAAHYQAPGRDVLCFGDSLIKLSLIPQVFEKTAGLSCYNLAVSGSQTPMSYLLLKRALEAGARPKAILVEFMPSLFRLPPTHNLSRWSYVASLSDAAEMAWRENNRVLFDRVLLNKTLTSMEARMEIRRILQRQLLGPQSAPDEVPMYRRHWIKFDGAQIMPENPTLTEQDFDPASWANGFYPHWYVNRVNRAYLLKFLDLANASNIEVYWLLPPIMPSVQDLCEKSGFAARQTAFLKALQKRYSRLAIIDGRMADYDEKVYMDPNHLGRSGAYVYSEEIGALMRERLSERGERTAWVSLPPYQARSVDVAIEDAYHTTPMQSRGPETRRR